MPVAGFGTRLLPMAKAVPKELLPIGDKPAIQYAVEEAVAAGIERIVFVCHPKRKDVLRYFSPDRELKNFLRKRGKRELLKKLGKLESLASFEAVYQREPRGLGDAVLCARRAVGDESFLVILPDILVLGEAPASVQLCRAQRRLGGWGLLLERVPRKKISSYGVIRGKALPNGCYQIEAAVEKPRPEKAPSNLAILGRYIFPPQIFDCLKKTRPGALGEIQLTDAINTLASESRGWGKVCHGKVLDVGNWEGFKKGWELVGRGF